MKNLSLEQALSLSIKKWEIRVNDNYSESAFKVLQQLNKFPARCGLCKYASNKNPNISRAYFFTMRFCKSCVLTARGQRCNESGSAFERFTVVDNPLYYGQQLLNHLKEIRTNVLILNLK